MSWKVMVHGKGDPVGHFVSNQTRFATKKEAEAAGSELYSRWMGMDAYHVKRSSDPVNYVAGKYGRARPLSANVDPGQMRNRPSHPRSRADRLSITARLSRRSGRRRYRRR
jgi:hypothetical protein